MSDIKNSSLATDLVSYWELEEASGTRVDSHGSNDLTDNNTVGQATGIQGNGADFESTNSESLSITHASQTGLDFGNAQDFSIQMWIKPESSTDFYTVMKGNSGASGKWYSLGGGIVTGQFSFLVDNGTNARFVSASSYTPGNWYHVVGVRDGTTLRLYVNGSSVGTYTNTDVDDDLSNTSTFYIGRHNSTGRFTDGVVDEVGIWSRALSASDVTALYNSGAGLPYEATASTRRIFVIS